MKNPLQTIADGLKVAFDAGHTRLTVVLVGTAGTLAYNEESEVAWHSDGIPNRWSTLFVINMLN